jgi:hypothetical protein
MKTPIILGTTLLAFACGGCSTGNPSARSEYSDPLFDSRVSKRAAREAEIRKIYPGLSEKNIQEKLANEFPAGLPR